MAENDKPSKLQQALTAAPAVGGLSIGLSGLFNRGFFNRSPSNVALSSLRTSATLNTLTRTEFMKDYGQFFRTDQGAEIARQAWYQAQRAIDPSSTDVLTFAGDISKLPSGDVASAIELTLQRNTSFFMDKVFTKFRRNIKALENQSMISNIMPQFAAAEMVAQEPARNVSISELPKELHDYFSRIRKTLGAYGTVTYQTRKGWEQQGFGQYRFSFQAMGKNVGFTVPVSRGGLLVEGSTLSSRRIAPDVMLFDPASNKITSTLSRHEFLLKSVEEGVVPRIVSGELTSQKDIDAALKQVYEDTIYSLESVPNIPPGMQAKGWEAYSAIGAQAVDIRVPGPGGTFRSPTDREFTRAMEASGLFPSTSPSNIAEGRLSRFDPSTWAMNQSAVDFSRRPSQARREWQATHKAVGDMLSSGRTRWSIFETQGWRKDMGTYSAPHLRTLYIDPTKHAGLLESIGMGEGESLASRRLAGSMEVSRVPHPIHLKSVRQDLATRIESGDFFVPGEVLGWDVEGNPVSYSEQMKLQKLVEHKTAGKGEFLSLFYTETHKMRESEKKFKDIKAMERMINKHAEDNINRQVSTLTNTSLFSEGIERWASMDELRKDPAKHSSQMVTAMWDLLEQQRTRDFVARNRRLSAFVRNPRTFTEFARRKAVSGGVYSHEAFTRNLVEFAVKEARVTPQEFGAVFGAIPSVFGGEAAKRIIPNEAFLQAASTGFVGGISQAVYGGPKELTGAGKLGSLEPRAFELLQAGQYGPLGIQMSQELAGRLTASNPEAATTFQSLTKTLQSVAGQLSPGVSEKVWDVSKLGYSGSDFQSFIEKGGGWMRPGKGMRDIFIPGIQDVPTLAPFTTAAGYETTSDLSDAFHEITRQAASLHSTANPLSLESYKKAMESFIGGVGREVAPGGRGAGSVLRGKLQGSRFLTGVSQAGDFRISDPRVIGIPENYAQQMFTEMAESGLYDTKAILDMRRRAMEGELIGGVVARHPFIGQYSIQPTNFRVLPGLNEPVMVLPSTTVDIRLAGQEASNPIRLSPMVGMAGDLDADIYSAMLVSPDLEKNIRTQFTQADNEFTRAYTEHNIRSQLIKAKAAGPSENLTNARKMIAESKKLGTAQTWVPRLSTSLTEARQAIAARLQGQEAANAAFLLEWLEQVPISGKHLKAEDVLSEKMSSSFQSIASAIETREPARLEGAINEILRESNTLTKSLLTERVDILEGAEDIRRVTGVSLGSSLPGINLQSTVANITSALQDLEGVGASRQARLMGARETLTSRNLVRFLDTIRPPTGAFTGVSRAAVAAKNFITSAGGELIKNHKAVGLGFAGSLAVATVLSKPRDSVGPGSSTLTQAQVDSRPGKAIGRMNQDMLGSQQSLGNPTVPAMMTRNSTMLAPNNAVRVEVRGRSNGGANPAAIANRLSRATGRDSSVNINIRDDRSSLSINSLANKVI